MADFHQVLRPVLISTDEVKTCPLGLINLNQPGNYLVWLMNYSGELSIDIVSSYVRVYVFGTYYGRQNQVFDLSINQRHIEPNSLSQVLIKGVFAGASRFSYKGLIKILAKAQSSQAYQKNQNLILSDKAYVESDPFLEIEANRVVCGHGSTTSSLSIRQLNYLLSRGLSHAQAERLMIFGFLSEVVYQSKAKAKQLKLLAGLDKILNRLKLGRT